MTQRSTPTESTFKQICLRLRNADPRSWDEFVACLEVYTVEVLRQLAMAPTEEILRMQGRSQQLQAILRLCAECHIQPRPSPPPSTPGSPGV